MVLNYIWIAFFFVAFAIGIFKLVVMGDAGVFPAMMDSTFASAKTAFEISLGLSRGCSAPCSCAFSPAYPKATRPREASS